jgi:hypothetical protein
LIGLSEMLPDDDDNDSEVSDMEDEDGATTVTLDETVDEAEKKRCVYVYLCTPPDAVLHTVHIYICTYIYICI